jgi:hypothetical protein
LFRLSVALALDAYDAILSHDRELASGSTRSLGWLSVSLVASLLTGLLECFTQHNHHDPYWHA